MTAGRIFTIQENDELIEMNEQAYDSESLLQHLIAKYPNLLAGEQMDSAKPRRWLLVTREMRVPAEEEGGGRWSLDHLFLDQDAIPTLIEVKRSSDTRIRREVIGQMLDYASNAVVYWPLEQIRAKFEQRCHKQDVEPEEELAALIGDECDEVEFWSSVKTNLQAGKIRMVFVADEIPPELRRIVEFLNGQMDPAEVLALEIKQFVGKGMKTLVPRVIGLTAESEKKRVTRRPRSIESEEERRKKAIEFLANHRGQRFSARAFRQIDVPKSVVYRLLKNEDGIVITEEKGVRYYAAK